MSTHHATVRWEDASALADSLYARDHELIFDGLAVKGSAAQDNVPQGTASSDAVDPEELFVASLAQCHMLWFLDLARQAGLAIESYEDAAEGILARNSDGKTMMTVVTLRPKVVGGATLSQLQDLHHRAHARCFIANSVRTKVLIEFRT